MVALTLDPRQALQPAFIEGIINKKMEQQLDFNGMFPEVKTDALSFSYMTDLTTAGADIASGKMSKPVELGELSELTEIEVSSIDLKYGAMQRFGYELRFSQRQLREPAFIDEITRAYDRAAFGIAKKMNDDIIAAIQAVGQDLGAGKAVWSDKAAAPVEDMLTFAAASMVEGYPYELKDLYVHKDNYFEMLKYLQGIDIEWVRDPTSPDGRNMPIVNGVNIHNTNTTQLAEGSYIGLDSQYPGLTIYQYLDPKHSQQEGGRINVNKYEEERFPYNIVVELFAERGIASKLPYALYARANGI